MNLISESEKECPGVGSNNVWTDSCGLQKKVKNNVKIQKELKVIYCIKIGTTVDNIANQLGQVGFGMIISTNVFLHCLDSPLYSKTFFFFFF